MKTNVINTASENVTFVINEDMLNEKKVKKASKANKKATIYNEIRNVLHDTKLQVDTWFEASLYWYCVNKRIVGSDTRTVKVKLNTVIWDFTNNDIPVEDISMTDYKAIVSSTVPDGDSKYYYGLTILKDANSGHSVYTIVKDLGVFSDQYGISKSNKNTILDFARKTKNEKLQTELDRY